MVPRAAQFLRSTWQELILEKISAADGPGFVGELGEVLRSFLSPCEVKDIAQQHLQSKAQDFPSTAN